MHSSFDKSIFSRADFLKFGGIGVATVAFGGALRAIADAGGGSGGSESNPGDHPGGHATGLYSEHDILWYDPNPANPPQGCDEDSVKWFIKTLRGKNTAVHPMPAGHCLRRRPTKPDIDHIGMAEAAARAALDNARKDLAKRRPDMYPDYKKIHARIIAYAVTFHVLDRPDLVLSKTGRNPAHPSNVEPENQWNETFYCLPSHDSVRDKNSFIHVRKNLHAGWKSPWPHSTNGETWYDHMLNMGKTQNKNMQWLIVLAVCEGEPALASASFKTFRKQNASDLISGPVGNATFEGAEITIWNVSGHDVSFDPGNGKVVMVKDKAVVTRIKADKNGDFKSKAKFDVSGTYKVRETKAPKGYLINEKWGSDAIKFSAAEQAAKDVKFDIEGKAGTMKESFDPNGVIDLQKFDSTGAEGGNGSASLEGAKFRVYNVSTHDIEVDHKVIKTLGIVDSQNLTTDGKARPFSSFNTDIVIDDSTEFAYELTTNDNGKAAQKRVPYGTYVIREIKAPEGYNVNKEWSSGYVFTIDKGALSKASFTEGI